LTTIKKAAEEFGTQEEKLDVLWNNAGVASIPTDQRTPQGYEMHSQYFTPRSGCRMIHEAFLSPNSRFCCLIFIIVGTNCIGPFLFTQLLLPKLKVAAKTAPKDHQDSVRIIWTSSIVTDTNSPKGGVDLADLVVPSKDHLRNYASSKAGNWLLAAEFARKLSSDGVVSIAQNPGNTKTTI
jgi:NAD(P)-dependent dehydrogenase (short-subunit alcohol dehydrogenase family)